MRITKSWLRSQRFRICDQVSRLIALTNVELARYIHSNGPNLVPENLEDRDTLLELAIKIAVVAALPDSVCE